MSGDLFDTRVSWAPDDWAQLMQRAIELQERELHIVPDEAGHQGTDSFQEAEGRLQVLTEAFANLTLTYDRRIGRERKIRNSYLPIYSLPVEILTYIFALALDPQRGKAYYLSLYEIASVSSHWRDAILHSPRLWSRIADDCPSRLIGIVVQRFPDAPLDLEQASKPPVHPEFLESVAPFIRRWRSAELSLDFESNNPEDSQIIIRSLEQPSPLLERVELSLSSGTGPGFIDIFRGDAPKLRWLALSGVAVPWESTIFLRLRTLELVGLDTDIAPSFQQLLTWLYNCPTLQHLTLYAVYIEPGRMSEDAPVEIPNLCELEIVDLPRPLVSALLRRLYLSSCPKIYLNVDCERLPLNDSFGEYCTHLFRNIQRCLVSATRLDLVFAYDELLSISFHHDVLLGETTSPDIELHNLPFEKAASLLDTLASRVTCPLHLQLKGCANWGLKISDNVGRLFELFPYIVLLDVQLAAGPIQRCVISRLQSVTRSPTGVNWALPHLSNLMLSSHAVSQGVLHMLKRRYGTEDDSDISSTSFPVRLNKLVFRPSLGESEQREIEAVVGEGRVDHYRG